MRHVETRMDAAVKARKMARRFGGWPIDWYYRLLTKYDLWPKDF
jgi:hypothetical protein